MIMGAWAERRAEKLAAAIVPPADQIVYVTFPHPDLFNADDLRDLVRTTALTALAEAEQRGKAQQS